MLNRHFSISAEHLLEAVRVLEAEGFQTHVPSVEVLAAGVVLVAWNPEKQEGFLLSGFETTLLARYGLAALDPHREPGDARARWERPDQRNRERAYAEAALARAVAEVATAPVGQRNNTLSRAAYGLGRLEGLGLDLELAREELIRGAVAAGLPLQEAQSTVRRGLEKGSQNPRILDTGYHLGYTPGIQNKPRSGQQKPDLGYSDTNIPRLGGKKRKLGGGG